MENSEKKINLSVIIPVYNKSVQELQRCFDSVVFKTFDYEVLIIDDGSKMEIGKFCREYAANHDKYVYVWKENGGVSSARNFGMEKAIGKYVMFIDADDVLVSKAFRLDDWFGMDLVRYDMWFMKNKKRRYLQSINSEKSMLVDYNRYLYELMWLGNLNTVCGSVYRLDFLKKNSILFDTKVIQGEDMQFNLQVVLCHPVIYYVHEIGYCNFYRTNTARGRWKNKPDLIIESNKKTYEMEKKIINESDRQDKEYLLDILSVKRIVGIYGDALDLYQAGVVTDSGKKKLYGLMKECHLPRKSKLSIKAKYYILMRRKWICILIHAKARRIYYGLRRL